MQNTKHLCTATEIKVSANYVWKPLRTLTSFTNYTKGKKKTPKLLRNSSSKTASKTKKEHSEIGLSSPGISTRWDSECFSRFAPRTATNHSALGRTPTHDPRYCHQLDALFQNGEWLPHSWSSWPCRVGVPCPPS